MKNFQTIALRAVCMHSFASAMPCSRSWRCWRSAEPSALNRRSEPSRTYRPPMHCQCVFHVASLRFQRQSLRLGRTQRLGAKRRHGQFQQHRLGDGRQPGRCGTDHLLARRPNPAAEQRRRRLRYVPSTTASSGPCRRRADRPRRFRAAACPTPTMPWPCPPPRPFPDRARSISSTQETARYNGSLAIDFRCLDRVEPGGHRQRPRSNDFDRHQSEKQ